MDTAAQDTRQPISDDQELAKALAGVMNEEPEEQVAGPIEVPPLPDPSTLPPAPVAAPVAPTPAPVEPVMPALPEMPTIQPVEDVAPAGGLDTIKSDALNELRPLVDKVDLPAEEKFDIYLMLIRSTDDTSLIAPAHAAAQGIADEKKKAEALLDIIKEIDYLSRKQA